MLQSYRLIWALLTRREKRQFVLLFILTVLMGVFEVAGVAAILPFLSLISDPGMVETNRGIAFFARVTGLSDPGAVTLAFGICVLLLLVFGMIVRAAGTYAQVRFAMMRAYTLSTRLLRVYLRQPYVWFLSQNSSEFGQDLLSEIDLVVRQCILPGMILISAITMTLLIAVVLLVAEPVVAIGATVLLGVVYITVFRLLRKPLDRLGTERMAYNKDRFQITQEIGGGIKEIKTMRLEDMALARFDGPARGTARTHSTSQVLGKLPRFALEAVIYGGFISMILFMLVVGERDIVELIPLFGLLGVSSMKLFPALQQIYAQLSLIQFTMPALVKLHTRMTTLTAPPLPAEGTQIRLTETLELAGIEFSYPGAETPTLRGLSTVIPARSTLGIVGGTGAGKTTAVDIILGLLEPTGGELRIDGTPLPHARRRDWQKSLGYVPQSIFLIDDTVSANIAFGLPADKVDHARVEEASRIANLHDFVLDQLPEGYATRVGERGVRLSGGQRQRIGIARALYFDPDVLVLDEATSALDNLTEKAVMDAVHNLGGQKTIIMIAHRLSTVQSCDKILMLRGGQVVAEGRYEDLIASDEEFRRMATG